MVQAWKQTRLQITPGELPRRPTPNAFAIAKARIREQPRGVPMNPVVPFVVGERYSREAISAVLGGSQQLYLPTVDNEVVCGCFIPTDGANPDAPEKVTFGTGQFVEGNARIVSQQPNSIPIFLFQDHGEWEYFGQYRCTGLTTDESDLEREMSANPARGVIAGVLYFERTGD